jgi:hypothetical protein
VKTLLGLVGLGWAAIGATAGLVYLLYLAAGSWAALGGWMVYLLGAVLSSFFALIVGANIWYTRFMDTSEPARYRRFQPLLDRRAARKAAAARALEAAKVQDGQLSEVPDGGRLSFAQREK